VGMGVGANKCIPFRRGGPGVATPGIFVVVYFSTKSCILVHSLAPKMGSISVYQDPCALGEMKTVGRTAEWGPKGRKSRPNAESGVEFLRAGSKPHQLGGSSDVNKTKFLRPK